jgi:hypothetical protein
MATRDGSDPTLKSHRMDSPAAAPIGIHLKNSTNDKKQPICAFLLIYNKLPKFRVRKEMSGHFPVVSVNSSRSTDSLVKAQAPAECVIVSLRET